MTGGIVRVGATVRREAGVWTPAVHGLLAHLDEQGYPAPRPLGFDDRGREVLTFIPGVAMYPDQMHLMDSPDSLHRVGRLIADYHRAQRDVVPLDQPNWRSEGRDPSGSSEVLAHNDLAPWNLIVGPGGWTFIDWDLVAPGRRSWDLAWALHSFVGLWPESERSDADTTERISAFCDGAEVAEPDRPGLLAVVVERTAQAATLLRTKAAVGEEHFIRMIEDGHADRWEEGSRHVDRSRARWAALL